MQPWLTSSGFFVQASLIPHRKIVLAQKPSDAQSPSVASIPLANCPWFSEHILNIAEYIEELDLSGYIHRLWFAESEGGIQDPAIYFLNPPAK